MNDNICDVVSDATNVVLDSQKKSSVSGNQSKTEKNITMSFLKKRQKLSLGPFSGRQNCVQK